MVLDSESIKKIATIETEMRYLREFIENDRKKFNDHIQESTLYRDKVTKFESFGRRLDDHIRVDMWIQGSLLLALIIKLFT